MTPALSLLRITPAVAADFMATATPEIAGECPACGDKNIIYLIRRKAYMCRGCGKHLRPRSQSLLRGQKMDDQRLVASVFAFCAAKKGISSCELARIVGMQQCSAYNLLKKFRAAVKLLYEDVRLSGVIEIDGAFFGGHIRHFNTVESGKTRRLGRYHYGNRRVVVVLKQRLGLTLTSVGHRESDAKQFIQDRIEPGSTIVVDQAHAWDGLLALYDMLRVNHKYSFHANNTNTNSAESYFASLRRGQAGTYHRISGEYLGDYAQEIAWRLDRKGVPLDEMMAELLGALLAPKGTAPEWWAAEMAA